MQDTVTIQSFLILQTSMLRFDEPLFDEVAYGAIHAAHQQGLAIGKEIAIAGFEGLRDSIHVEPPLTTLDIPIPEISGRLVRMLLALLDGTELPEREIVVHPTLMIRASTGGSTIP